MQHYQLFRFMTAIPAQSTFDRRFRNIGDIVEEPNSSSKHDFFRPWYDCQRSIDIKFLNYSGNV